MIDGETLTVLLGAGASHDCVFPGSPGVNQAYRPPLVHGLFADTDSFNATLHKYQRATWLSDLIRSRLAHGEHFEDILGDLRQRPELNIRHAVWEISLYLQELLGEVSRHYVDRRVTKFDTLIAAICQSRFRNVLFLTVNYDTLLEQAIRRSLGHEFDDLRRYNWPGEDGRHWALVKLHGSTCWGRRLRCEHSQWSEIIGTLTDLDYVDPEVVPLGGHQEDQRRSQTGYRYPALAVPLKDKQFVCPESHVDIARGMLRRSSLLLVIGFSGLDQQVLELVAVAEGLQTALIVDAETPDNKRGPDRVLSRFKHLGGIFQDESKTRLYRDGFRQFVDSRELERQLGLPVPTILSLGPARLGEER